MHQFWFRFILPLIQLLAPQRVMEVGAEFGWNTRRILTYCRETGARLTIVDPVTHPDLAEVLADFGEEYVYFQQKSLDAIPQAESPDLVLLDGDHNWHTIHAELHMIYRLAAARGAAPPVALMHDCGWPYARRDMYYDPESLGAEERHPYAYLGFEPGRSDLFEGGLNGHLANARHEGGPRNGVLTGVEDFIAEARPDAALHVLPFFNGMGILLPRTRATPELEALIASFYGPESLLQTVKELEESHMRAQVEMAQLIARFTRRTDALIRARRLLKARGEDIQRLEADRKALEDELQTLRAARRPLIRL